MHPTPARLPREESRKILIAAWVERLSRAESVEILEQAVLGLLPHDSFDLVIARARLGSEAPLIEQKLANQRMAIRAKFLESVTVTFDRNRAIMTLQEVARGLLVETHPEVRLARFVLGDEADAIEQRLKREYRSFARRSDCILKRVAGSYGAASR